MYKYLLIILFIFLLILPASAVSNVEPSTTCKPTFIYVTVTVPPAAQPTPQIIYVPVAAPTATQSQSNTSSFSLPSLPKNSEYVVYVILFLSLVVGMIALMKKKKLKPKQKPKRILDITTNVDELYEETPEPIEEKIQPQEDKPKKPKKMKSLLDQDFEL